MTRAVLIAPLLLCWACGPSLDDVPRVTAQELHDRLAQGTALALDVRTTSQYEQGHIKGAGHIPQPEIEDNLDQLPTDRLIVTYCS